MVINISAESRVTASAPQDHDPQASEAWEDVRARLETMAPETHEIVQYIFDSPLTVFTADLPGYALESFTPGRPLLAAALDLMSRIHEDFRYDTTVTDASTPVDRVFEIRAGVCQDLAHIGIAAMRSLGLPARYVSGYLLTKPPPGQERLIGADASHAWFSVWAPPFGWVDLDPTNDLIPGEGHITVAWGRDYSDVAPINGIVTGGGDHLIEVGVDVIPVEWLRSSASRGQPSLARSSEGWLGREDSNLRMPESKSGALPLGYAPMRAGARTITADNTPGNAPRERPERPLNAPFRGGSARDFLLSRPMTRRRVDHRSEPERCTRKTP